MTEPNGQPSQSWWTFGAVVSVMNEYDRRQAELLKAHVDHDIVMHQVEADALSTLGATVAELGSRAQQHMTRDEYQTAHSGLVSQANETAARVRELSAAQLASTAAIARFQTLTIAAIGLLLTALSFVAFLIAQGH